MAKAKSAPKAAAKESAKKVEAPAEHHVVAHEKGWAVKRGDSERVWRTYEKKGDAEAAAKEISMNQKTVLKIHNKEGAVQRTVDNSGASDKKKK